MYKIFVGAGILGKILKMGENGSSRITRVLFCGPNFPAAQNYTREYVKDYPFIQVLKLCFISFGFWKYSM